MWREYISACGFKQAARQKWENIPYHFGSYGWKVGNKCNHLEKKQYTRGEGSLWGEKIVFEIIYKPVNEAWCLGDMELSDKDFQRFSDLDLPGNWNVCVHIDFLPHLQEISKDASEVIHP